MAATVGAIVRGLFLQGVPARFFSAGEGQAWPELAEG